MWNGNVTTLFRRLGRLLRSDRMEASSARSEAFSRQQLAVQRANLLGVCKMCIKSIVDKSTFEAISDDCPHLQNFCTALEHIFTHRLQSRWTLFGGNDTLQYWHVISRLAPAISVGSVEDMGEVQSELGKGRAWFHLSLVQKKLSSFMQSLLSRQEVLRSLYLPGAFLCSDELTELAGTLKCLDSIDFNLCLRGQDFNSGERLELSYFPYLQFQQSAPSHADDSVEERKLRSSVSRKVRLWKEGEEEEGEVEEEEKEEGEEEEEGGGMMSGEVQLREMIKTERDQKNYFEELVSVRDTQLAKMQTELSSLSEENERLRKEMEGIVLELQQQLEQKTLELREAQRKIQELSSAKKLTSIPEKSQSSSTASPRKRSTSFSVFSSFLGSRD